MRGRTRIFKYNGGAVVPSPQVYTSFWGPLWNDAAHTQRSQRLNQFVQDLLNSEYMNVLSQYGVGTGAGATGRFIQAGFVPAVASQLDENAIAQVIQAQIDAGALPEPPAVGNNVVLILYLDETLAVSEPGLRMCEPDSDDAFGFHSDFVTRAENEFYYAVVPALHDQVHPKHLSEWGMLPDSCPDTRAAPDPGDQPRICRDVHRPKG